MKFRLLAPLTLAVLLSDCMSLAPVYKTPTTVSAAQFSENGAWVAGHPADQRAHGDWWTVFQDPVLSQLEGQVIKQNPTLQVALEHYQAARDVLVQVRSQLFPTVTGLGGILRNRQSAGRPLRGAGEPSVYSNDLLGAGLSWDMDLWGQIKNAVAAQKAQAQVQAAHLAAVQLSLQADLAASYMAMRGVDWEEQVFDQDIHEFAVSARITQDRFAGGIASGLDVSRAQEQLSAIQALRDHLVGRRAVLEHEIAVLLGEDPNVFHLPDNPAPLTIPVIPVGVPSVLLQRRPDVAEAERQLAAANALIGVAKAAYFPNFTIDAFGGFQSMGPSRWLSSPNLFWSLGPSFLVPIFDANAIAAQVAQAKSNYSAATAHYRETVLKAFKEVEDQLALLNSEGQESKDSLAATQAAHQTARLAFIQYKEGAVSYLEVAIAQTTELQAERYDVSLEARRIVDAVNLARALGGGWEDSLLPSDQELSTQKVQ